MWARGFPFGETPVRPQVRWPSRSSPLIRCDTPGRAVCGPVDLFQSDLCGSPLRSPLAAASAYFGGDGSVCDRGGRAALDASARMSLLSTNFWYAFLTTN